MAYARQARRKRDIQIIPHTIHQKPSTLPKQVVMMGDSMNACLGNELCQRYSQRDIKWNRRRILDQKHVNIELLDEFIQMAFEKLSQFVDSIRQLARADAIRESHV